MALLIGYLGCAEDERITPDSTPPAKIDDLTAYEVTEDSISLTWTAPGNDGDEGTATEYELRYSTQPLADSVFHAATLANPQPVPSPPGRADSAVIAGLDPYTEYHVAIRAGDGRNLGEMSNVVSVTTDIGDLDIVPPDPVTDLAVSSVTNAAATLTWTATGDDGAVGQAASYDLRFAFTEGSDSTWWAGASSVTGMPAPAEAGAVEQFTVEGLLPDTTYYFALVVSDKRPNDSELSNVVSATTPPDTIAPAAPTDLMVAERTHDSVTLVWTAPGDDGGETGTAAAYDVRYSTTPGDDLDWFAAADTASGEPAPSSPRVTEDFTVTGLESETLYYFALRVRDEIPNWSDLSNVASESTMVAPDTIPPAAITDLAAQVTGDAQITLSWTAPGEPGGAESPVEYQARYTTGSLDEDSWETATEVPGLPDPGSPGTPETVTITALDGNRRYSFAVRWAKQADEDIVWSEISAPAVGVTPLVDPTPIQLQALPGGSFIMGDGASFCGNEEHEVTLSRGLELGAYEITNRQYLERVQWAHNHGYVLVTETAVLDTTGGAQVELLDLDAAGCELAFADGIFSLHAAAGDTLPDHPVKEVSWYGAAAFCDWLNRYEGLPDSYDHAAWTPAESSIYDAPGYRLPTDAEWEYAARYDDDRLFPWGDDLPDCSRANYWECQVGWTTAVGSYPAAPSITQDGSTTTPPAPRLDGGGFYDLAGNVWEWCHDGFECSLGLDPVTDPVGTAGTAEKVLRGSSWYLVEDEMMRCAYRGQAHAPSVTNDRIGFRIARSGSEPPPKE